MRIGNRITAAVTAWTVAVMGVHTWLEQREAHALMQEDLYEECVVAVTVLSPGLARAWEAGGEAAVDAVLERLPTGPDELRLRLVRVGDAAGPRAPARPEAAAFTADPTTPGAARAPVEAGDTQMFTYVSTPGFGAGLIVEARASLADEDARVGQALREAALLGFLITSVSILLASWMSWTHVGRRVEVLARIAREAAAEREAPRADDQIDDEIGALAGEMNRMADGLAALREARAQDGQLRGRLAEELRHADRLGTVGMLMGRVAHELGTPLTVIAARAGRVARGQAEGEAAREQARVVVEQAGRIQQIIRSMLDFGRKDGVRAAVEPGQVAARAVGMVEPFARSRGVSVVLQMSPSLPPGPCLAVDALLIEQALVNLLVNALHESPSRAEVELGCAPSDAPRPGERSGGPHLVFEVRDRGPGLPAELREAVFQPFFTTRPAGEGTGLGLAITANIVEEHGGWMEVLDRPGGGATFQIHLPLVAPAGA